MGRTKAFDAGLRLHATVRVVAKAAMQWEATNAGDIVGGLSALGVRFSKAVSYGNGADLRAHHFLDYAAADPQTRVVTAYSDGARHGRPLFDPLSRRAAAQPPALPPPRPGPARAGRRAGGESDRR